jgi:energy-coupling factor transport system ATP-binding protein
MGKVFVGDWETTRFTTAQLAGRVSFLFQNPDDQLFERTVRQEVAFGPRNLGFSDRKISTNTSSALKTVGLADRAETNPYDLEPNERKLLAFAATLAMDTPVLVLDEPSIGQDVKGRQRIGHIIQDLHKMGRTILLISHDLDFCAEYCERAIVMADGKILAQGSTSDVFSQSDVLSQAAVIPPQLIRLAQALKMSTAPLTVKQFVTDYARWRKRKPK